MQALTMAGNMLAMFAITKIIEGIQYLSTANERYIESQEQIIDEADKNIQKYDDEIQSLEQLQSRLKDAYGNKAALADVSTELNSVIGNTPGLINGEAEAYDIASKKLQEQINYRKELKKLAVEKKVNAEKEIFNNIEVDRTGFDFGIEKFQKYTDYYKKAVDEGGFKYESNEIDPDTGAFITKRCFSIQQQQPALGSNYERC